MSLHIHNMKQPQEDHFKNLHLTSLRNRTRGEETDLWILAGYYHIIYHQAMI